MQENTVSLACCVNCHQSTLEQVKLPATVPDSISPEVYAAYLDMLFSQPENMNNLD